ncbi:MAG TPA: cytochrome c maturation protein CcmE [Rhodopila sp.]|nr:cytochrome c maturation protein CcmE [Rhodopila sp.]
MTRKRRRLLLVSTMMAAISASAALVLWAMSDNLVFFVTPTQMASTPINGRQMRLGGLVEPGTIQKSADSGGLIRFKVTDGTASQAVVYRGTLPDLFREGQGVVVSGVEQPDGVFKASEVLAKHDEKYMPKAVANQLKASGEWRPDAGTSSEVSQNTRAKAPAATGSGS